MRRQLRHVAMRLLAAAGAVMLAGALLMIPAAAQAAPARAHAATQAHPGKRGKLPAPKPAGVATPTSDTRPVCGASGTGRAACLSVVRTNVPHSRGVRPAAAAAAAAAGYGPADLQSAYSLPSGSAGAGEAVAVVDAYDDPTAAADLAVYRAQYGLPPCTVASGCFTKVNQDGLAGPLPAAAGSAGDQSLGWDVEEALDLDMVSAACQNCRIILVEANSNSNTDLYRAEDTAVALGAKFISDSWGGPEEPGDAGGYPGETTGDAHFNHPGVVITAASGDSGEPGALYPAASPYVTAVGGTSLSRLANGSWSQSAWGGTTTGCSRYEPKPAWQADTGCAHRTVADVSAVADPQTGVAFYNTSSTPGWGVVGGTSAAAPLIAAAYALAGPPTPGTNPASYPYAHPSGLTDITAGTDGETFCPLSYLCAAGPGYDGLTGLGTPDGVSAFGSGGSYGTISGTISGASGPLAGATVTAGGAYPATTTTDASGGYTVAVPAGRYTVTAQAPGYQAGTAASVAVTASSATTEDLTLSKAAQDLTLSGTVTDGSGHKWPVYAAIAISGYPDPVYTDPQTGRYSVSLPEGNSYTLTVDPVYPGYGTATAQVTVGSADVTRDIAVIADPAACDAPGYAYSDTGPAETFTGWSGSTPQDGWSVVDNRGNGRDWTFSDPEGYGPPPGGSGGFAAVEPAQWIGLPNDVGEDTSLVSPAVDLSGAATPVITFDTYYGGGPANDGFAPTNAAVELSLDGGQTWTGVWAQSFYADAGLIRVPVPQAAGKPDVRVRFHFTEPLDRFPWEVDNVFIGNQACSPVPGGLVTGTVTDHNTGKPVNGATITSVSHPDQTAVSGPAPDSPGLPAGFYWLFAFPDAAQLTATDPRNYAPATQALTVAPDAATRQDLSLPAGNLAASPGSIAVTQVSGTASSKTLTLTNTGTEPVHVRLDAKNSGFTPLAVRQPGAATSGAAKSSAAAVGPQVQGAPLKKIPGHYSPDAVSSPLFRIAADARPGGTAGGVQPAQATPSGAAWGPVPDYPTLVADNAVAYDPASGSVYSAGGQNYSQPLQLAVVYKPLQRQWAQIANLPVPLWQAGAAFTGGRLYVAGGYTYDVATGFVHLSDAVFAYTPSTDSWSQVASLPAAPGSVSTAVLDGALYVIGGCAGTVCTPAVYRYNTSTDTWMTLASYPHPAAFQACAGIDGEVVCAGGIDPVTRVSLRAAYAYNPATDHWSAVAPMPYDDWGMAYAGSGNELQVVGGVTGHGTQVTNQAVQYDPVTDTWSALPNANQAAYRGGGSCGLYQVGGITGPGQVVLSAAAQVLPGYGECGDAGVSWLSASSSDLTIQPGQSQAVTVTLSAAASQPGTYAARIWLETNTPYQFQPVDVAMTVTAPVTWSQITGTVTDAASGQPLAGATVQVCANYKVKKGTCGPVTYTLTTDTNGHYQLWLDRAGNPLEVIAAMAGYQPATRVATLVSGVPVTVNFALSKSP